jgi:hypothetical protein
MSPFVRRGDIINSAIGSLTTRMTSVLRESLTQIIIPRVLLFVSIGSWVQLYLSIFILSPEKKIVSVRQMISADNNMGLCKLCCKKKR